MKRSFVYLVLALALSLLLSGCGDMTDHGNVSSSPFPAVTEPVLPIPSLEPDLTPSPDPYTENGTQNSTNSGTQNGAGMTGGTTTASPRPTDSAE